MRVCRPLVCSLFLILALALGASASAQSISDARRPFVDALIRVLTSISGAFGDERGAVTSGLRDAEAGLRIWDAAIDQYREAVSRQLTGATPAAAASLHIALGAVFLDRGRVGDAVKEFTEAATLDPARPDALRFRALAHESAGRMREASADFAVAWKLDPRDPAAAYLFLFHRPSGERRTADADPVGTLEAFARQRTGASGGAAAPFVRLSLLEERQSTEPVFLPALYAEAARQLRRRRYDEAVTSIRNAWNSDAINSDSAVSSQAFLAGAAALREGQWTGAVERLAPLARELTSSSEARRMLGTAYWLDDQNEKAVQEFRAAIAANPRDERSRIALADLYIGSHQTAEAERVLRETAAMMPESGQAHWRLGRVLEILHRDADARQERERALAAGPVSGESRVLNAIVREYRSESDADKAIELARARVAVDFNDAAAHDQLGQAYLQAGNEDDALVELLVAILLDPSRTDSGSKIAQVYLGAGRYSEAMDAARRVLAADPGNREARFALGRSLQQLGQADAARSELAAAERLQAEELEKTREAMATNLIRTEALLREQQGKWDEAAALRRDVTTHAAAVPSDYVLLAEALAKAGRHDEAIDAFRAALSRDSQPEAYRGLIREYVAAGRTTDADATRAAYERIKRQRFLESVQAQ